MIINLSQASVFSIEPNTTLQFPLNHARILYNNIMANASVSVDTGDGELGVLIPTTIDRYVFTNTAVMTFTLPTAQLMDTVCIGAHSLQGYTVLAEYDDDDAGTFTNLAPEKTVSGTTAVMIHRQSFVTVKRLKITLTGTGINNCIAVIYGGISLQVQRPYYGGSTPINLNPVTSYYNARTETGNFVGREIRSKDYKVSPSWKNLTDDWYRTYFTRFTKSAQALPFFFAWNLLEHPYDVGLCITEGDISPSYQGKLNFVQVSADFLGIG